MPQPAPGVVFGRYRLLGEPEYYGAGSLVDAEEIRTGAPRTLWLLMPHVVNDPATRQAVVQVATVLRRLDVPHLVRLHEFGEVDGQPFFALAADDGPDLAELSEPHGINPIDALELIAQVGSGISHVHHAGLVDGALGPHRIVVTEEEGKLRARVCDAGLLPVLLSTSALFGSQKQEALDYGAPELHRGDPPTVRSDIYSLGSLLWLTLTGQPPFATYVEHRSGAVPQVEGDGIVQEAVNAVLRRAMAKDPAHRYGDAAAFVATLRTIAALAREDAEGAIPQRLAPAGLVEGEEGPPDVEPEAAPVLADEGVAGNGAHAHEHPTDGPHDHAHDGPHDHPTDGPHDHAADGPAADLGDVPAGDDVATGLTDPREPADTQAERVGLPAGLDVDWSARMREELGASERIPEDPADFAAFLQERDERATHASDHVEPALLRALDHWKDGRRLSLRRRRKRLRGAALGVTLAMLLGGATLAAVWAVRHSDVLDKDDARPAASASASPSRKASARSTASALEQLFPIAAKGDCVKDPGTKEHRVERWTCDRNGYRVVLTRWDSQKTARQLVAHAGDAKPWTIDGATAGTQWTWNVPGKELGFRWTAVYADVPYAVIIEARTPDRRAYARGHVVLHPSTVLG